METQLIVSMLLRIRPVKQCPALSMELQTAPRLCRHRTPAPRPCQVVLSCQPDMPRILTSCVKPSTRRNRAMWLHLSVCFLHA